MEIARKLLSFKYEFSAAVIAAAMAARFWGTVLVFLSFFWPLLVSTCVVLTGSLVMGVGEGGVSSISAEDIPGKSYIEFVAGKHVELEELVEQCYQKKKKLSDSDHHRDCEC
uniref:Uncharacterized protein n=1 Tax=Kalanchoe fedtschenkoi TaxID=63787 RepID=A0A7N1A6K1_KALFE